MQVLLRPCNSCRVCVDPQVLKLMSHRLAALCSAFDFAPWEHGDVTTRVSSSVCISMTFRGQENQVQGVSPAEIAEEPRGVDVLPWSKALASLRNR